MDVLRVDLDAPHREQHLDDADAAVARGDMEGGGPSAQRAAGSPMPNARKCSMPNATCMRLHAHAARHQHADDAC